MPQRSYSPGVSAGSRCELCLPASLLPVRGSNLVWEPSPASMQKPILSPLARKEEGAVLGKCAPGLPHILPPRLPPPEFA